MHIIGIGVAVFAAVVVHVARAAEGEGPAPAAPKDDARSESRAWADDASRRAYPGAYHHNDVVTANRARAQDICAHPGRSRLSEADSEMFHGAQPALSLTL
jgi:hypothetical protein